MLENDIRPARLHDKYIKLSKEDARLCFENVPMRSTAWHAVVRKQIFLFRSLDSTIASVSFVTPYFRVADLIGKRLTNSIKIRYPAPSGPMNSFLRCLNPGERKYSSLVWLDYARNV